MPPDINLRKTKCRQTAFYFVHVQGIKKKERVKHSRFFVKQTTTNTRLFLPVRSVKITP